MRTITVIGASLAGLHAALALRTQGYDGRLVIVGEEHHRPYDRPPLSKEFLTGALTADRLSLADAEEIAELEADWLLGTRAEGLDPPSRTVALADGRRLSTDGVVLATGAAPPHPAGRATGGGAHPAHPGRRRRAPRGAEPGTGAGRRHRRRLHRGRGRLLLCHPRAQCHPWSRPPRSRC